MNRRVTLGNAPIGAKSAPRAPGRVVPFVPREVEMLGVVSVLGAVLMSGVVVVGCNSGQSGEAASAGPDAGGPALSPGAVCVAEAPAVPDPVLDPSAVGGHACDGNAPEFTPSRPLGFGYPDGSDVLPPHVAYLTVDDGPSDWTGDFLDILKAKGVHATFFVNARNFKGPSGLDASYVDGTGHLAVFRDVLARTVDEGHVLGNHTTDHLDLAALSPDDVRSQLDDNERLVNAALVRTGRPRRLLTLVRPPYGSPWFPSASPLADPLGAEIEVGAEIAARGLVVMWTIDSSDSLEWAVGESPSRQAHRVTPDVGAPSYEDKVARIQQTVLGDPAVASGAGVVILLHDTHDTTRDALPAIIDGLRVAGYGFGTIEELAQWRWRHPSLELTPGPGLYDACASESDWGCATWGSSTPVDRTHAACGRLWRAFENAGGEAIVGAPIASAAVDPLTGIASQRFARGIIATHPEIPAPCDVVLTPN